jgi:hypothetical protein
MNGGNHRIRDHRSLRECDVVRKFEQVPCRGSKVFGVCPAYAHSERAVRVYAKGFTVCATVEAFAACEKDIRNYSVTDRQSGYSLTDFVKNPRWLVTQNVGKSRPITRAIDDV